MQSKLTHFGILTLSERYGLHNVTRANYHSGPND